MRLLVTGMGSLSLAYAFYATGVTDKQKLLLLTLAEQYNDELDEVVISIPRLSRLTRMSIRSLQYRLIELEDAGLLVREPTYAGQRQGANRYRVLWRNVTSLTAFESVHSVHPPGQHGMGAQRAVHIRTVTGVVTDVTTQGGGARPPMVARTRVQRIVDPADKEDLTPLPSNQRKPAKPAPAVVVPKPLQPVLAKWATIAVAHGPSTKALRDGVAGLKRLLSGTFFNALPKYEHAQRTYTVDELLRSMERFDAMRNNPDYLPVNKRVFKGMQLPEFLYSPYLKNGDNTLGASMFLQCLKERPKLAPDTDQELTEYVQEKYKQFQGAALPYEDAVAVARKLGMYWASREAFLKERRVTTKKRLVVEWMQMLETKHGVDWTVGHIISANMNQVFEAYVRQ